MFQKAGKPLLLFLLFIVVFMIPVISEAAVPKIKVDELYSIWGEENLVIIDVRKQSDWEESDKMIQGAVRKDPEKTVEWMKNYPKDKKFVLYCA